MTDLEAQVIPPTNLRLVSITNPQDGLVAYLRFDEGVGATATDSSGNGNTGILVNGPTWTTGKTGQAAQFDGIDDYVSVPFILNPSTANFTAAAWVYATGEDTTRTENIILVQEDGTGIGRAWLARTASTASTPNKLFTFLGGTALVSTSNLTLNNWYHVVVTVNGAETKLYLNGTQEAWATTTQNNADGTMRVASHKTGVSGEKWQGRIDEVRIYSRALSASEVQALYYAGADISPPVISAVSASSITASNATITWNTNEPSDSRTEYGPTTSYGNTTTLDPTLVTSHSQAISGLSANATYHYRVNSKDPAGNAAISSDFTFTAPSASVGQAHIKIERNGETGTSETAPYAKVWIDSLVPTAQNPAEFSLSSDGSHRVYSTDVLGLVESVGTCAYPTGGHECVVTDFPIAPQCDGASCSATINLQVNQVTKVAFNYIGVYEGFGANTIGGKEGMVVHVTNLNPSGSGSFASVIANACQNHNRYVIFDVAGEITTAAPYVNICGHNITIDGLTAPAPGITLRRTGLKLVMNDSSGTDRDTRDIIIRGLRIRMSGAYPAGQEGDKALALDIGSSYKGPNRLHNIVIDHNSISGSTDDQAGISRQTHDVTFSWNMISGALQSRQNFILDGRSEKVSVHHNFFGPDAVRNPLISYHNDGEVSAGPSTISADIRSNLMYLAFDGGEAARYGTYIWRGAKANIVNNYYLGGAGVEGSFLGMKSAIVVCNVSTNCAHINISAESAAASGAYVDGNVIAPPYKDDHNSYDLNATQPFAAPAITHTDPFTAACQVAADVGVHPIDADDEGYLDQAKTELSKFGTCSIR